MCIHIYVISGQDQGSQRCTKAFHAAKPRAEPLRGPLPQLWSVPPQ